MRKGLLGTVTCCYHLILRSAYFLGGPVTQSVVKPHNAKYCLDLDLNYLLSKCTHENLTVRLSL